MEKGWGKFRERWWWGKDGWVGVGVGWVLGMVGKGRMGEGCRRVGGVVGEGCWIDRGGVEEGWGGMGGFGRECGRVGGEVVGQGRGGVWKVGCREGEGQGRVGVGWWNGGEGLGEGEWRLVGVGGWVVG